MPRTRIGDYLRERRMYAGVTQDRLARMAGVPRSQICAIESGHTPNPSSVVLAGLARALNMDARAALNHLLPADVSPMGSPAPRIVLSREALAAAAAVVEQDRASPVRVGSETLVQAVLKVLADTDGALLSVYVPPPAGAHGAGGRLARSWGRVAP